MRRIAAPPIVAGMADHAAVGNGADMKLIGEAMRVDGGAVDGAFAVTVAVDGPGPFPTARLSVDDDSTL